VFNKVILARLLPLVNISLNTHVHTMSEPSKANRRYTQRRRAESQAETRRRIVEAAMHLHEELGPRATTIKAIAERAGVQRLTVYRHFPDDVAVFQACTAHWAALNPPPDPAEWADVEPPLDRLRTALTRVYGYYRDNRAMLDKATRDAPDVPALHEPQQRFTAQMMAIAEDLAAALGARGPDDPIVLTVGHALAFTTWQTLDGLGCSREAAADLVCRWMACLAGEG
jgi:AcrR family transcriptional regulator